ncbi:MAG: peptide chain release factor N(5)-glutamine methyltransferase [Chlorobiaceae bacterium]|nr:peptide chain release factor N(5)-glutamine methyltransferase [Chlorobiaceae bacterium]MBA4310739.1 peptide chain release factor N(5)-glutamine methyltransferase [Chlorobiaceae bacterium]
MPTILELINLSTGYLEKKGIESPRINSELLLADILSCKRLDLYLFFDKPVSEGEVNVYRNYISRRANNEPLQYILGKVDFYGTILSVDKSVLIPRQETEILVEKTLEFLKNDFNSGEIKILDIGTGSGNIAISLILNCKNCIIDAVDVSQHAIAVASKNANKNNVQDKINFIKDDFRELAKSDFKYNLIISNPPYVAEEEYLTLQKEILNFEPKEAVTDFKNGLSFYEDISAFAKNKLLENGRLIFEVGINQADAVKSILEKNNFFDIKMFKDYNNIYRVVTGVIK